MRFSIVDGEPWFVAADVCAALSISKYRDALARLDADERASTITGTPGGPQSVATVSEAGVFRLIFSSRKPEAERFKRWLAHEVLPELRRTGRYGAPAAMQPGSRDFSAALRAVKEARMLGGKRAGLDAWAAFGLPTIQPELEPERAARSKALAVSDGGAIERWWGARLSEGSSLAAESRWLNLVACDRLFADYWSTGDERTADDRSSRTAFGMGLRRLVPRLQRSRRTVDGSAGRAWCYELPALDECREHFQRVTGRALA
ncbi:BRO-N domain-containing protein [Terrihabitans sp. B22-R8]|uniref:BRO-N domain-containing protein n=1 Tax=Terrihabitans sp. B22-R8 TaxID=3425128 RepID=UPI00403CBF2D